MELGELSEESAIDKPAYKAVAKAHGKFIFRRRILRLARAISSLIPTGATTVLDVGSGSGEVALALQQLKPSLSLTGMDVLVRDQTAIPTQAFDGVTLPCANKSFDIVILVDVLHHSHEPIPLLAECARVAKQFVIIKDHYSENWFDHVVLRVMDWIGNASHKVRLEYR
jgi:ubiquinone/menaquinone biosynthesis C-methylase UbiE